MVDLESVLSRHWIPRLSILAEFITFLLFCGIHALFFFGFQVVYATYSYAPPQLPKKLSHKQIAWIPSLLCSSVMAISSLFYAAPILFPAVDTIDFWADNTDQIARLVCLFFLAYLIMDLALGMQYYKDQVHLLSGWIHHSVYIAIALTLLITAHPRSCPFFSYLEIPTVLLSLSRIFPEMRSDTVFNIVFFCFRIVLHLFVLIKVSVDFFQQPHYLPPLTEFSVLSAQDVSVYFKLELPYNFVGVDPPKGSQINGFWRVWGPSMIPAVLALFLHIFWFRQFLRSLGKKRTPVAGKKVSEA